MGIGKGHHLYLIDGSAYIFRAYHALPPLTRTSDGLPVGAVAGFCGMLHKMVAGFGTNGAIFSTGNYQAFALRQITLTGDVTFSGNWENAGGGTVSRSESIPAAASGPSGRRWYRPFRALSTYSSFDFSHQQEREQDRQFGSRRLNFHCQSLT